MSTNVKISVGLVAAVLLGLVVAGQMVTTGGGEQAGATSQASGETPVVRDNSHRLSATEDERVTLVEFLDFECEACGAAYPFVEELRQDYDGELTVIARYFPLPSHANSENAAIAAEAAAQQGAFEAMYKRMFETQIEWGERQDSQAALFRSFAEELGLDLEAYDQAVADPATMERVEQDRQDGLALGVQGTPTFFLNGELLQPTSLEEFRAAIEAEIDG